MYEESSNSSDEVRSLKAKRKEEAKDSNKFLMLKGLSNLKSANQDSFVEKTFDKKQSTLKSAEQKTYSDSYNIIIKELKVLKKIDEGAYGEVKLAKYQGNRVALKYFKKNGKAQEQLIEEFTKEIKALDKLRHPNILFYMGYFYEKNNFVMVSQFASMGSLYNLLHRQKQQLSEEDIITIIRQIVQAMIYTHSSTHQATTFTTATSRAKTFYSVKTTMSALLTSAWPKKKASNAVKTSQSGPPIGWPPKSSGTANLTSGETPTKPAQMCTRSASLFGKWSHVKSRIRGAHPRKS